MSEVGNVKKKKNSASNVKSSAEDARQVIHWYEHRLAERNRKRREKHNPNHVTRTQDEKTRGRGISLLVCVRFNSPCFFLCVCCCCFLSSLHRALSQQPLLRKNEGSSFPFFFFCVCVCVYRRVLAVFFFFTSLLLGQKAHRCHRLRVLVERHHPHRKAALGREVGTGARQHALSNLHGDALVARQSCR